MLDDVLRCVNASVVSQLTRAVENVTVEVDRSSFDSVLTVLYLNNTALFQNCTTFQLNKWCVV